MNIAKVYFRSLIVMGLLLLGFTESTLAQDTPFVIMSNDNYLAHVKNGSDYELQNATSFNPTTCLWYSGPTHNATGYTHNYYFEDDEHNLRFLAAPLASNGTLSLSASLPSQSLLRNTDQIYYFYNWDPEEYLQGVPEGGGIARGHQHQGVSTADDCDYSWGGDYGKNECWQVYWIEYSGGVWKLTQDTYYSIYQPNSTTPLVPNAGKYRKVTVTEHELVVSNESNGLQDLADFDLEWVDNPLSSRTLSATINYPYTYDYIPAYTGYEYTVYTGTPTTSTYYYYGNAVHASAPSGTSGSASALASQNAYEWTITGDGAEHLSFANDDDQFKESHQATPTLYYINENQDGHKTATLTLTITYADGAKQTRTATVLVKTPCENPVQAAAPVVTYENVTVSWVATAESYTVSWKKTSDSDWTEANVGNVTSYTITGLDYETEYQYKVTTSCDSSDPTIYTFTTNGESGLLVYGAIFGGGRMADVYGKATVTIVNCDTIGAIYGGNDIAGDVRHADGSIITLGTSSTTDTIRLGSVYGGGNGYYAYNGSSFVAASSSYNEQAVAAGASVLGMNPDHTVGDAVWTNETGSAVTLDFPSIVKTTITVNNDYIKVDSLFGGAKNAFLTASSGNGSSITIDGGTLFAVYGGNNFGGGQGYGIHYIEVNDTKNKLATNITNTNTHGYGRDFGIRYLFGGGNKVYGSTTDIRINGGQTDNVFGGGNAADVYRANVTVDCNLASGSNYTYGDTYSNAIQSTDGSTITVKNDYAWDGKGIYNVRNLYGGNNEAAMNSVPTVTLTSGSVGTVYGGGNAGDMLAHVSGTIDGNSVNYSTFVTLNSPTMLVDYIYGGCRMSNVDYSTWVKIQGGHVGSVFGGCNVSGDVGSTCVNPGANHMSADYQVVQGGTYVEAYGGTIYKNLFAGGNGFYHCNENFRYVSGVNYSDPENYVGMVVPTHNETHAYVYTGATIKGNVYAGGNLAPVGFVDQVAPLFPSFPTNAMGWAMVHIKGGTVQGNVFGGGNMADIYGSNDAQVMGGTVTAVYGGNDRTGQVAAYSNRVLPSEYQHATDGNTSLITPQVHAYVRITGNPTIDEVYGGGNGDYDYVNGDIEYCRDNEEGPIQSNTFVDININGGTSGGHIGTVYGGGDGVTATGFITVLMNIVEPSTPEDHDNIGVIFGGNNKGDLDLIVPDIILLHGQVGTVYGGCNQGAMNGSADITSTDGNHSFTGVGSLVRLRSQYTANGVTVVPTAKVSEAVYGGCRMNGVSSKGLVLVEGLDWSHIPLYGGSDISGNTSGTSMVVVCDGTVGDAYGGGNGNYDYTSGDYVGLTPPYSANSIVKMFAGTADNLFAGGYAGESGDTYALLSGGTVNKVFGGGNMAGTTTDEVITGYTGTGSSTVSITGGTVNTGVYGGCNASGDIEGTANVSITGGTVGTDASHLANVHGGGYGSGTETSGNVNVTINGASATVWGDVYGGSALGSVNDALADITTVTLTDGTVHGDIYGGGLGDLSSLGSGHSNVAALVNGTVNVVVNGGTVTERSTGVGGRVFGANNLNGTPHGPISVTINGTDATVITAVDTTYAIQGVYGGGNLAAYVPTNTDATAAVTVNGCASSIKDVYGGGNAAPVSATDVTINGGFINRAFAGGNGESGTPAHVGYNSTAASPDNATAYGTGNAEITLTGGTVIRVFGGSNANGLIRQTAYVNTAEGTGSCDLAVTELYGGGNMAHGNGSEINIGCFGDGSIGDVYGGARMANINEDIVLNILGGNINRVFGGNNISGTVSGSITVNVDMDNVGCSNNGLNYVYGGGNLADYTYSGTSPVVNIKNGEVTYDVFGGGLGSTATVTANPVVTVGDPTNNNHVALVHRNVYGGGSLAEVVGNTTVNIRNNNTVVDGNVFGAGLGDVTFTDADLAKVTGNTMVNASAGLVKGNIYGGGSLGTVDGTSGVTVSGTAKLGYVETGVVYGGKVFGAGLGNAAHTDFATVTNTTVTTVNAEDVEFNDNVYGGGKLGIVTGNTLVTINSGTLKDVYGAGQGDTNATGASADIQGSTTVNVNGGTIANVYGGGQNGTVHYIAGGAPADAVVTTLNITGGTVTSYAFGGGDQGTTQGRIVVNMNGGLISGELFGGAKGTTGSVFVAGLKTVNIRGGIMENHVYGGSRNANDGMNLNETLATAHTATNYTAFVNMSAGEVRGNVYGAGYYGHMFGSSDINIGKTAIESANTRNIDRGTHTLGYLHIFTHVYAGSNWGEYNPAAGFGRSTTTGHSNIYLDGTGYNTQSTMSSATNYMNIEGSLYGSGTSCDAGTRGRKILVANYGVAETGPQTMADINTRGTVIPDVLQTASRSFQSIQRCDTLIFDNASVEFSGQGDISQNFNTAEYSLFYIDKGVWVRNGSNIIGNKQIDEIHALFSEYRPGNDLYTRPQNQTVYWIGIGDGTAINQGENYKFYYLTKGDSPVDQLPNDKINTLRINQGYAIYMRYTKLYMEADNGAGINVGSMVELNDPITGISDALRYGELNGFFRIVTSETNETFAHARPKITQTKATENTGDGGFMSYYNEGHNIYDRDNGNDYTRGLQFPYTNMTRNRDQDRPDYRFWQVTTTDDKVVNYDAVLYLYSQPESADSLLTVEYVIELPSLACTDGYYELNDIDYGDNVRIVDAGIYDPENNSQYYIVYNNPTNSAYHHDYVAKGTTNNAKLNEAKAKMLEKPNTRFGLVLIPDGCLALNPSNEPVVLSNNAKPYIIPNNLMDGRRLYYPSNSQGQTPKVRLRVTYYKELTQSVTLAPVVISMKSYCGSSTVSTNDINIEATFTTQTALGQDVNVTAYAMYDNIATNTADETYTLKVTLPAFIAPENSGGHETPFYIYQEEYHHNDWSSPQQVQTNPTFMVSDDIAAKYDEHSDRYYAVSYIPAPNADNKNGWAHSTVYNDHELNLNGTAINTAVMTGNSAVKVGEADGRNPISIDFTLHYNSNDVTIPAPYDAGDVGTVTFKVCYPVLASTLNDPVPSNIGDATVPTGWKRFNINFTIYKKTFSRGFFLDGIMGDDKNSGNYADHGLRSIQGVLDNGWTPGDNVLVVRPITVTSNTVWSNSNNFTISLYRYPGDTQNNHHEGETSLYNSMDPGENTGHNLYNGTETTSAAFFIVDGSSANLQLDHFILDGMNGGNYPFLKQPNPVDPDNPLPYDWTLPEHQQEQQAPLIDVIKGKVSLSNCELRYSQNISSTAKGGAIRVADGATLNINNNTTISHNKLDNANNNGAGVYVEDGATVNLKGLVNITNNLDVDGNENNVYLEALTTTVTIDKNNGLDAASRIGVYKTEFYTDGENKDLTPIATSAFNSRIKEAYINKNFIDDTRRSYVFHYYDATTLYFGKTWAHYQTTNPDAPNAFNTNDINSAADLAWFISYANGLNGEVAHPNAVAKLTGDIPGNDLNQHYWLPIEDFTGTFDGQWYKIDGLTMRREGFEDMGLIGHVTGDGVNNGVVKNVLMTSADIQPWNPDESIEQHVGAIVGRVSNGGTVIGCQAMPTINATEANRSTYVGGVVGDVDNGGIVHSVIGMPTLTGYTMGGVVGKVENGGGLYNSYSSIAAATNLGSGAVGGLVGYNLGVVENNYVHSQMQSITPPSNFGWFVGRNGTTGQLRYAYAPEGEDTYYNTNEGTFASYGNYETDLLPRKAIGYLYDDNKVTIVSGQTNTYHSDDITFANAHIDKWPGMVSALDQWAKEKNTDAVGNTLYGNNFARWFRPGTANINGDFPVLGLYGHNTMAAANANPLVLDYGSDTTSLDKHTSLDNLLTKYSSVESSLFVFGNATGVTGTPSVNDSVFIHEHAVLQQSSAHTTPDFQATVGITFDNSWCKAHDYFQNQLYNDWHLMSSSLSNAPMGISYGTTPSFYNSPVDITEMVGNYLPNELPVDITASPQWDLYSYYEEEYHWINLKRRGDNHWHLEDPTLKICYKSGQDGVADYVNENIFVPGKGYMMAIDRNSYLSNTGLLNNGPVTIKVTAKAPAVEWYDMGSNLVGNPYQAYLNLKKVAKANSFVTGFYFYTADLDNNVNSNGLYVPYDSTASTNPAIVTSFIHPHQAFFVVTDRNNTEETMTFNSGMTVTSGDADDSYFRGYGRKDYPLVNLYVTDGLGNADLAIVEFNRPELGGVRKIDNLRNADFKLYAHMEDEDYSLLFAPEGTLRVPVFFKTPHDSTYTLTWRTHNGNFATMYLIDNREGIRYDMLSHDTYEFTAKATDYAARFYIEFEVTGVDENDDQNNSFAYFNGYGWVIEGEGQLELVDMLGRVLYTDNLFGDQTLVHFDGVAAGMYMLRLVDGDKLKAVQKIVIRR